MRRSNAIAATLVVLPLAVGAWAVLAYVAYQIGAGAAAVIDIISRSL